MILLILFTKDDKFIFDNVIVILKQNSISSIKSYVDFRNFLDKN